MNRQLLFGALLLITALAFFSTVANASANITENPICTYVKELGVDVGDQLPGFLPYKNEVVNIYSGNNSVGTITTEDGNITTIDCNSESSSASFHVSVKDLDSVKTLFNAASPVDEFNNQISNGDLVIEGQTTGKKIKGFFSRLAGKIVGLFI